MRKVLDYLHSHYYLEVFVFVFFFLAFFIEPILEADAGSGFVFNPARQVFAGYFEIMKSPSILLTDYVYVAGLGATFFNVATIMLANILLVQALKFKMNGPIFAGIIMIGGFSFFGKNIFNTIPIYLGIYLYSLFKKIPFKQLIITILFSTGLSPLVSYTMFGFGLHLGISIPLGILCGCIAGFIIPVFASHTIIFHEGYNLYNTGFALGILSAFFYAIFSFCGLKVESVVLYEYETYNVLYYLLLILPILCIILAYLNDHHVHKKYFHLLKTNGRLISDYGGQFGEDAVLLNFGILGFVLLCICLIFQVPMNGAVFGTIFAAIGFAGYGLHIRNVAPIWVGCGLTIFIGMAIKGDYTLTISSIMMFVFASGLAPVSGRYGIGYGLLIGALHIILTPIMISFQGGFDLYNNGLAAGFEAALVTVLAEKIFVRRKRHGRKSKDL
ncbi:MAG: DUF1576 domain-containing protein [Anaeroplasmataceae bacterium]|nr:DUF1576 domain-containing protein [Anaeroplasmataceae bacterium]MDE6414555.1 DUF1576 domain-containing protein [Anaeroplasmataceae bacterium]